MSDSERFLDRAHMTPSTSHAVVEVTMFIETAGPWGKDCSIAQAVAQATDDAKASLRRMLAQNPGIKLGRVEFVKVVCGAERDQ